MALYLIRLKINMNPMVINTFNWKLLNPIGFIEPIFLDEEETYNSYCFWMRFWNSPGNTNQLILNFLESIQKIRNW